MYVTQFNKANKVNIPFSSELKYLASFEKLTSLTLFFMLHVKTPSSLKIFAYNLSFYIFHNHILSFLCHTHFLQKFYAIMTILTAFQEKNIITWKTIYDQNMNNNNNFTDETKNGKKGWITRERTQNYICIYR